MGKTPHQKLVKGYDEKKNFTKSAIQLWVADMNPIEKGF